MKTLTERIASFLKLADACLTLFDTITPTVGQPFIKGVTPPRGFDGYDPDAEAADAIPQEILENGGWENELIEQARGVARELAPLPWGEDAVKSLLAFIRALKGSTGAFGVATHGAIDRKLWEQVRADLEDAAEYLRIDVSKPANGTPANGTPANGTPTNRKQELDAKLRPFLAEHPDAKAEQAAEFLGLSSKARLSELKLPCWLEHVARKQGEKLPPKTQRVPWPKDLDKLLVDGPRRLPSDPVRDKLHEDAYGKGGDGFSDPETFRSKLLDIFHNETETSEEYRAAINRLKTSDLSALIAFVKQALGEIPTYEQEDDIRSYVEHWLDDNT